MYIHLITAGQRMPGWVQTGFEEYTRRMPVECRLNLIEVPLIKRNKDGDIPRIIQEEGVRLLKAVPKNSRIGVLDRSGKNISTPQLANTLEQWLSAGQDMALLIGGPDGLSAECLQRAEFKWSLSALTFPHPLVRIMVAEQLYRAMMILKGHPYHK